MQGREGGFEDVVFEREGRQGVVAIDRPAQLNAVRPQTLPGMAAALESCQLGDRVRAVILTGTGDTGTRFCVGGDSGDLTSGHGHSRDVDYWHTRVHQTIRQLGKPVIAGVNGHALGGSNVLVTVCDLAIAAEHAQFGQLGPRVTSFGAAYLARVVGEEAEGDVVPLLPIRRRASNSHGAGQQGDTQGKVAAEAKDWCEEMAQMSPTALKFLKYAFNADSDRVNGFEKVGMSGARLCWENTEAM